MVKPNHHNVAASRFRITNGRPQNHVSLFLMAVSIIFLLTMTLVEPSMAFVPAMRKTPVAFPKTTTTMMMMAAEDADDTLSHSSSFSVVSERRSFLNSIVTTTAAAAVAATTSPHPATASADTTTTKSTSDAVITSKVFIDLKGIPSSSEEGPSSKTERIIIGLFGQDAPQPVSILLQLLSPTGLPSKCKPLESRTLQREQLEANKVYNSCMETQDSKGVTYDLSSVWRVDKNKRIDLGAVSGKFVSRENPTFESSTEVLRHDAPGVVSVRRGNDGGFGFTIYPGSGSTSDLDEDNIVVGKVLEGMDVVERLNNVPVVQSSSINYMGLTGGQKGKNAPSRACRYGGPMYCNELKPLKKILIESTGVL